MVVPSEGLVRMVQWEIEPQTLQTQTSFTDVQFWTTVFANINITLGDGYRFHTAAQPDAPQSACAIFWGRFPGVTWGLGTNSIHNGVYEWKVGVGFIRARDMDVGRELWAAQIQ